MSIQDYSLPTLHWYKYLRVNRYTGAFQTYWKSTKKIKAFTITRAKVLNNLINNQSLALGMLRSDRPNEYITSFLQVRNLDFLFLLYSVCLWQLTYLLPPTRRSIYDLLHQYVPPARRLLYPFLFLPPDPQPSQEFLPLWKRMSFSDGLGWWINM